MLILRICWPKEIPIFIAKDMPLETHVKSHHVYKDISAPEPVNIYALCNFYFFRGRDVAGFTKSSDYRPTDHRPLTHRPTDPPTHWPNDHV